MITRLVQYQPLWVVVMAVVSGALLHGFQLQLHNLFWDHPILFPAFAEHYNSLNRFGELQWWTYNESGGAPSHYLNILGNSFLTPLSILSSSAWWLLGRLGLTVTDWVPFYVIYHMVFVPLVFLGGFYSFLCHIVREPAARFFGLAVAAFGPAAAAGVYGIGIELVGYAFLFMAAWLHYVKDQNTRRFALLVAASAALFISFNHLFLYWVILFIPLMFAALQYWEPQAERRPFQVLRSMPRWQLAMLLVTVAVVVLPSFFTFLGGSDWLRSTSNSRIYGFEFLRPGNPLQLLMTVVPGIGFQFLPNDKEMLLWGGYALTNHHEIRVSLYPIWVLGSPLWCACPRWRHGWIVSQASPALVRVGGRGPCRHAFRF